MDIRAAEEQKKLTDSLETPANRYGINFALPNTQTQRALALMAAETKWKNASLPALLTSFHRRISQSKKWIKIRFLNGRPFINTSEK